MSYDARAVQHAYERIADGYADRFGSDLERSEVDSAVLDDAISSIGSSALVLDLGCGPGQVSSYVMDRGVRAVGIDITPEMLAVTRQHSPRLALAHADMLRLPIPDGGIDATIAWFSLHNLPRAVLGEALDEVRRVLRPNGVFVMATHAGTGEEFVEHEWRGEPEQVVITYHERDQLRSELGRHRLTAVDVRTRPPLDHERAVTKLFVTATTV